jgi:hypothetical protein
MTGYKLVQLARGSYDVLLNGTIIASLARNGWDSSSLWSAELLEDLPPGKRPNPFTEVEHRFATFEEARAWLGNPLVEEEGVRRSRADL